MSIIRSIVLGFVFAPSVFAAVMVWKLMKASGKNVSEESSLFSRTAPFQRKTKKRRAYSDIPTFVHENKGRAYKGRKTVEAARRFAKTAFSLKLKTASDCFDVLNKSF